MLTAIAGIVLVIVAVALWLGGISLAHAMAFLIGIIGLLLALYWVTPAHMYARRR